MNKITECPNCKSPMDWWSKVNQQGRPACGSRVNVNGEMLYISSVCERRSGVIGEKLTGMDLFGHEMGKLTSLFKSAEEVVKAYHDKTLKDEVIDKLGDSINQW